MELVTTRQSAHELKQVELRLQFLQTYTLQLYHILQSITQAIYPWMMLKPSQN